MPRYTDPSFPAATTIQLTDKVLSVVGGMAKNITLSLLKSLIGTTVEDSLASDSATNAVSVHQVKLVNDALANKLDSSAYSKTENFTIACSDRATAITTGTNKMSFRNVGARKLNSVRASLDTAGTGTATAIDINVNGISIFTTTLTIDATEETSVTAQTPFAFKATSHSGWSGSPNYQIDDNAKVSIDFDAVGTGAKGLDVAFLTERV